MGRAAEIAPRLMDLRWGKTGPKITLIGKGITFDTGGLDLKPSKAMEMMKKDMGGAATVLGLAAALMESGLDIQLRVLVAAAENAVSDRSMRPLDIIDTRAGIKVEVGNTDAEGRLVLSDAITHALEDSPDFMIDFATLTGAARVALGTELPALFCNDDQTASAISKPLQHSKIRYGDCRYLMIMNVTWMLVMLLCQVLVSPVTAEPLQQHCFYAGLLASPATGLILMLWLGTWHRVQGGQKAVKQWGLEHYTVLSSPSKNPNNHAANQRGFLVQAQP